MTTLQDLLDSLAAEYAVSCPAEALLYASHAVIPARRQYGLRVEAASIMLEFTDHVPLGTDPKGTLFYDDLTEFSNLGDLTEPCYYVAHKVELIGGAHAIHIKWYSESGDESTVFAEFVALDSENALGFWSGGIDKQREGNWVQLNRGSVPASLRKRKNDQFVTLKSISIEKTIKIELQEKNKQIVAIQGYLTYKDIKNLASGTVVWIDYNPDRIIFYGTTKEHHDFTAYFITNFTRLEAKPLAASGHILGKWEDTEPAFHPIKPDSEVKT